MLHAYVFMLLQDYFSSGDFLLSFLGYLLSAYPSVVKAALID
jgi:hypothetical protein